MSWIWERIPNFIHSNEPEIVFDNIDTLLESEFLEFWIKKVNGKRVEIVRYKDPTGVDVYIDEPNVNNSYDFRLIDNLSVPWYIVNIICNEEEFNEIERKINIYNGI